MKSKERIATFIGAAIGLLVIGGFVLKLVDKVRTGQGLDYYLTGHGVQMNYLGALITIIVAVIALLVGWIIRIFSRR